MSDTAKTPRNNSKNRTHIPVDGFTIEALRTKKLEDLLEIAASLNIEDPNELKRQDLIFEILKTQVQQGGFILFTGILEIMQDGYGFLRAVDQSFSDSMHDAYVSSTQIRRFALRNGDIVTGQVRAPKDQERYYALLKVEAINYLPPEESKKRPLFENLTPLYALEQIKLEYQPTKLTGRMMDLFAPIGKGQRGLIVAPPRSGKTELMKEIAHGVTNNHPEIELMVLLVDERPEEVTDMERSVKGEVYSSTFDEPAKNHVKVAEMVIERAKRRVELGKDVVILLDSITRLARAYNTVTPSSGKVLSGGVDANALHKPKRFFGAARNIENGGSLTIIATALVETGSRLQLPSSKREAVWMKSFSKSSKGPVTPRSSSAVKSPIAVSSRLSIFSNRELVKKNSSSGRMCCKKYSYFVRCCINKRTKSKHSASSTTPCSKVNRISSFLIV